MTGSVAAGTWVGGYTLIRPLGRGGAGTVWEAEDEGGTRVALKLLHPATAADEAARARILRQARLVNKIPSDRVAKVLDVEADALLPFVVTELVVGPTLEQVLADGPLQREEAADLAEELAEVLTSVHSCGVAHRDLKPSNIVLAGGTPILIDFELSRGEGDSSLTSRGSVLGTPGYLAPELLISNTNDISALQQGDWFAWNATLLKMLTGLSPFGEGRAEQVIANVSSGAVNTAGLPPVLASVFERSLQRDPQSRLAPKEVLAALRNPEEASATTETSALCPQTQVMPPSVEPAWAAHPSPPVPPAPTPAARSPQPRQQAPSPQPRQQAPPPQPHRQAPSPQPHQQAQLAHPYRQPQLQSPQYVGNWLPQTGAPPWEPQQEARYPFLLATMFTLLASSLAPLAGTNGIWGLLALVFALQVGGNLGLQLRQNLDPYGRVPRGRTFRLIFTAPLSAVVTSLGLAVAALASFAAVALLTWMFTALDGYSVSLPIVAEWLVRPQPLFASQSQTFLVSWIAWWLWTVLVWMFPTCAPLRFGFKQMTLKLAPSRTRRALVTIALLAGVMGALVLLV